MDFSFLERALIGYFQKHPEIVDQLVDALVKRLVAYIQGQLDARA